MDDLFLPGLPVERIRACYANALGKEMANGKFANPESSAALVANAFGLFLDQPEDLPPLPGGEAWGWPATALDLEATVHFPWSGGHQPCLNVLVETPTALIGIESKRYEPFRTKSSVSLSDAYWQPVWGTEMTGYTAVRDRLGRGAGGLPHLDVGQLIKHAFGLRTAVHRNGERQGKQPVLLYLYAEPERWPDGRLIPARTHGVHREGIAQFADWVSGDEVIFKACSYSDLLADWTARGGVLGEHAKAVTARFAP